MFSRPCLVSCPYEISVGDWENRAERFWILGRVSFWVVSFCFLALVVVGFLYGEKESGERDRLETCIVYFWGGMYREGIRYRSDFAEV